MSGRIVRFSKAATTGRINAPQQEFQIPLKNFEKPKIFSDEVIHTTSNETKNPNEQFHNQFTPLHEVASPRNSTIHSSTSGSSKDKNNNYDLNTLNAYHAICEDDNENYSDLDNVEDLVNSQLFSPTRGRSKSDSDDERKKDLPNISSARKSFLEENNSELKYKEFDTVSGFDDHINNEINDVNNFHYNNNNKDNNNNNNKDNIANEQNSKTPEHNSNLVHLPPIVHPTSKNWNVADIEEENS